MSHLRVRIRALLLHGRPRAWTTCAALALIACGGEDASEPAWSELAASPDAALLSVSGTGSADVWMVGADDGNGPLALHWDGAHWSRQAVASSGDLWWVFALSVDLVYAGGTGGRVVSGGSDGFQPLQTPGASTDTVFGVWAASETDVYAVGSHADETGFVWHDGGDGFTEVTLPDLGAAAAPSMFKVWGTSGADVWIVGERGTVLRGNARDGFAGVPSGFAERLFTVHANAERVVMVGGSANGVALENTVSGLESITPPGAGPLQGVWVTEVGDLWAVGVGGNAHLRRASDGSWHDLFPPEPVQSLHAVWADAEGNAWAVGGNVLTQELDRGVALRYGRGALPLWNAGAPE